MSPRRLLLLILLAALGACAVAGMFVLIDRSGTIVWRLLGSAFVTVVTTALMMPLSLLTDRPRLRSGGITAMIVLIICWLMMLVTMWADILGIEELSWRPLCICWQISLCGLPATVAFLLGNFRWCRMASWLSIDVNSIALGIFLVGDLMPTNSGWRQEPSELTFAIWGSAFAWWCLGGLVCLLMVNVGSGDRRYFRWAGVLPAAASLACWLVALWIEQESGDGETWAKTAFALAMVPLALAHVNLLLMARLKDSQRWLQWGTMAVSAIAGISAMAGIFQEWHSDLPIGVRIAIAMAMAAGCGSLGVIVLWLFNLKSKPLAVTASEFHAITLECPSCQTRQLLPLGQSACRICSLQIFVRVMEPHCDTCGYLLYNIHSDRCPECGAPIRKGNSGDAPPTTVPVMATHSPPAETPAAPA